MSALSIDARQSIHKRFKSLSNTISINIFYLFTWTVPPIAIIYNGICFELKFYFIYFKSVQMSALTIDARQSIHKRLKSLNNTISINIFYLFIWTVPPIAIIYNGICFELKFYFVYFKQMSSLIIDVKQSKHSKFMSLTTWFQKLFSICSINSISNCDYM